MRKSRQAYKMTSTVEGPWQFHDTTLAHNLLDKATRDSRVDVSMIFSFTCFGASFLISSFISRSCHAVSGHTDTRRAVQGIWQSCVLCYCAMLGGSVYQDVGIAWLKCTACSVIRWTHRHLLVYCVRPVAIARQPFLICKCIITRWANTQLYFSLAILGHRESERSRACFRGWLIEQSNMLSASRRGEHFSSDISEALLLEDSLRCFAC